MRALLAALMRAAAAGVPGLGGAARTRCWPIRRSRRGRASISADLRCLVCQNQSIDDSDADLAHDLRVIVRERLVAGDSDEAVRQYVVDRYGEYRAAQPGVGAAHASAVDRRAAGAARGDWWRCVLWAAAARCRGGLTAESRPRWTS